MSDTDMTLTIVRIPKQAVPVAGYSYVVTLNFGSRSITLFGDQLFGVFNLCYEVGVEPDWAAIDASLADTKAWRGVIAAGPAEQRALFDRFQTEEQLSLNRRSRG